MPELSTPYYDAGGVQIYLGDAHDILPLLPKADLVLTDPPYGQEAQGYGRRAMAPGFSPEFTWDAQTVDMETMNLVLQSGEHLIIWGGNNYPLPPTRSWLAWFKSSRLPTMADFELAWTNFSCSAKAFEENRHADGKQYHPTQKPLSLIRWCIGLAPKSDLILDPFCGAGTTLVIAKELGRRAVGIDISEDYCKIAVERLKASPYILRTLGFHRGKSLLEPHA